MTRDNERPLSDFSMIELFQSEVEAQSAALTQGLLELERDPARADTLERLMRSAHSLKGAARLVGLREIGRIAHQMEELFIAAQRGELRIAADGADQVLRAIDLIKRIARRGEAGAGELANDVAEMLRALDAVRQALPIPEPAARSAAAPAPQAPVAVEPDRGVRVNADRLTRLLGLASELVVDSHRSHQHVQELLQVKRRLAELVHTLDALRDAVTDESASERIRNAVLTARRRAHDIHKQYSERYLEADDFERRFAATAARIHRETMLTRMRPFADGVAGFPRMVRDIARSLGKQAELRIAGMDTEVDRDILDRLEAPLTHLLRNAVDHGIETPAARIAAGKPEQGTIYLSAGYSAGLLQIELRDDGSGVDFDRLRARIVARGLAAPDLVERLGADELLEFLYLPKFSTRDEVTEFSGRGVGLDVVREAVQRMGGTLRTTTETGRGTRFRLHLPITLSLLPALLVEIRAETYAFPLSRIDRVMRVASQDVRHIEGRQYVSVDGDNVGLVSAATLFDAEIHYDPAAPISIVLVSDRISRYGVVVDRIDGERVLAVQALDPRLGKIRDIAAAAVLDDGTLALVVDVDDFVRSIDHAANTAPLQQLTQPADIDSRAPRKHVLVVDDSITVRGVESKLLESRGYRVTTAVDGMDGWNRVRDENFDLVITDVDMPRMDGLELVQAIKADQRLRKLPVMIVSYKDRPEDRQHGLDAGADYYLTKGSFHDETLLDAVIDLIGAA